MSWQSDAARSLPPTPASERHQPWRCTHILGPCIDGTLTGTRCQSEAVEGTGLCPKHGGDR